MGGSNYSESAYSDYVSTAKRTGRDVFGYDEDVRRGRIEAKVSPLLDPAKLNKAGILIRESRDSDVHPESVPVAVFFDETGSMGTIPRRLMDKLDKLMGALVQKGFLKDPHVLFGAIGDASPVNREVAPLQVGQFEGGNEMDEALTSVLLEGRGGGSTQESYELAFYFMARKSALDSLEKRGKKGYMFVIGDETPYDSVKAEQVRRLIGDDLQNNIPTEEILAELREKFEVFWIRPDEGSYTNDARVTNKMKEMFKQNWIPLERAEDIVELIVTTIGIAEGFDLDDVAVRLKDVGADPGSVKRASNALAAYAGGARAISFDD